MLMCMGIAVIGSTGDGVGFTGFDEGTEVIGSTGDGVGSVVDGVEASIHVLYPCVPKTLLHVPH